MLEYTFMARVECYDMMNFTIDVVGNPNAVPDPIYGELFGITAPYMDTFDIEGLQSIVCPEPETPTQEESWGAIKSLYNR